MSEISESVSVDAPIDRVYDQWALFTTFPRFMRGVENIDVLPDRTTHWTVNIGGIRREFDARTVTQDVNRRIAWSSISGPRHSGVVEFQPLESGETRVTAIMDIDPEGFVENAADKTGVIEQAVKDDMLRFKRYIEDGPAAPSGSAEEPMIWPPPM